MRSAPLLSGLLPALVRLVEDEEDADEWDAEFDAEDEEDIEAADAAEDYDEFYDVLDLNDLTGNKVAAALGLPVTKWQTAQKNDASVQRVLAAQRQFEQAVALLFQQYTSGTITYAQMMAGTQAALRSSALNAYNAGKRSMGDLSAMDEDDEDDVDEELDDEYTRLDAMGTASETMPGWLNLLITGATFMDPRDLADIGRSFMNRMFLYSNRIGAMANLGEMSALSGLEDRTLVYWELGGMDHCLDCLAMSDTSPFKMSALKDSNVFPGSGHTRCGTNCQCSLIYDMPSEVCTDDYLGGDEGYEDVDIVASGRVNVHFMEAQACQLPVDVGSFNSANADDFVDDVDSFSWQSDVQDLITPSETVSFDMLVKHDAGLAAALGWLKKLKYKGGNAKLDELGLAKGKIQFVDTSASKVLKARTLQMIDPLSPEDFWQYQYVFHQFDKRVWFDFGTTTVGSNILDPEFTLRALRTLAEDAKALGDDFAINAQLLSPGMRKWLNTLGAQPLTYSNRPWFVFSHANLDEFIAKVGPKPTKIPSGASSAISTGHFAVNATLPQALSAQATYGLNGKSFSAFVDEAVETVESSQTSLWNIAPGTLKKDVLSFRTYLAPKVVLMDDLAVDYSFISSMIRDAQFAAITKLDDTALKSGAQRVIISSQAAKQFDAKLTEALSLIGFGDKAGGFSFEGAQLTAFHDLVDSLRKGTLYTPGVHAPMGAAKVMTKPASGSPFQIATDYLQHDPGGLPGEGPGMTMNWTKVAKDYKMGFLTGDDVRFLSEVNQLPDAGIIAHHDLPIFSVAPPPEIQKILAGTLVEPTIHVPNAVAVSAGEYSNTADFVVYHSGKLDTSMTSTLQRIDSGYEHAKIQWYIDDETAILYDATWGLSLPPDQMDGAVLAFLKRVEFQAGVKKIALSDEFPALGGLHSIFMSAGATQTQFGLTLTKDQITDLLIATNVSAKKAMSPSFWLSDLAPYSKQSNVFDLLATKPTLTSLGHGDSTTFTAAWNHGSALWHPSYMWGEDNLIKVNSAFAFVGHGITDQDILLAQINFFVKSDPSAWATKNGIFFGKGDLGISFDKKFMDLIGADEVPGGWIMGKERVESFVKAMDDDLLPPYMTPSSIATQTDLVSTAGLTATQKGEIESLFMIPTDGSYTRWKTDWDEVLVSMNDGDLTAAEVQHLLNVNGHKVGSVHTNVDYVVPPQTVYDKLDEITLLTPKPKMEPGFVEDLTKTLSWPDPEDLAPMPGDAKAMLGGYTEKQIYLDKAGTQWLFKPGLTGTGNVIDRSIADLHVDLGLLSPQIRKYKLRLPNGKTVEGSLQQMIPGAKGIHAASELSAKQVDDLLNANVVDFLVGNDDAHLAQWLIGSGDRLWALDKTRSFEAFFTKYDTLDIWQDTHGGPGLANLFWRDVRKNPALLELIEPRVIVRTLKAIRDLPDDRFEELIAPVLQKKFRSEAKRAELRKALFTRKETIVSDYEQHFRTQIREALKVDADAVPAKWKTWLDEGGKFDLEETTRDRVVKMATKLDHEFGEWSPKSFEKLYQERRYERVNDTITTYVGSGIHGGQGYGSDLIRKEAGAAYDEYNRAMQWAMSHILLGEKGPRGLTGPEERIRSMFNWETGKFRLIRKSQTRADAAATLERYARDGMRDTLSFTGSLPFAESWSFDGVLIYADVPLEQMGASWLLRRMASDTEEEFLVLKLRADQLVYLAGRHDPPLKGVKNMMDYAGPQLAQGSNP